MSAEIKLTLNVSGENFSPEEFNKSLPDQMKGDVKMTRKMPQTSYWYYESPVSGNEQPEELLTGLIQKYGDSLMSYAGLQKYASIVGMFKSKSDIRGFFISRELIKACNENGFEMDIDLYES